MTYRKNIIKLKQFNSLTFEIIKENILKLKHGYYKDQLRHVRIFIEVCRSSSRRHCNSISWGYTYMSRL